MISRSKNEGAILPLIAIALFSLVAIGAAAMDFSHVFVVRSSLQNALDAAALSAAKSVNNGLSTSDASSDADTTYNEHVRGVLSNVLITPVYEYSTTLSPFVPGAVGNPQYVRATVAAYPVSTTLLKVVPGIGNFLNVGGTAVAGPIPLGTDDAETVCDLAPLIACGDPADLDCDDNNNDGLPDDGTCFGYPVVTGEANDPNATHTVTLKTGSGKNYNWDVGAGNFQLAELGCGRGGACVRREIAGAGDGGCADLTQDINTEPGNTVGPTVQGFNTRFGDYQGPISAAEAPPDKVITSPLFYYEYLDAYKLLLGNEPGVAQRRILAAQIGNCTGTTDGRGTLPRLGIGCFFMIEKAKKKGNEMEIVGQFIKDCPGEGEVGTDPGAGPSMNTYKIVLYKDPDTNDT